MKTNHTSRPKSLQIPEVFPTLKPHLAIVSPFQKETKQYRESCSRNRSLRLPGNMLVTQKYKHMAGLCGICYTIHGNQQAVEAVFHHSTQLIRPLFHLTETKQTTSSLISHAIHCSAVAVYFLDFILLTNGRIALLRFSIVPIGIL